MYEQKIVPYWRIRFAVGDFWQLFDLFAIFRGGLFELINDSRGISRGLLAFILNSRIFAEPPPPPPLTPPPPLEFRNTARRVRCALLAIIYAFAVQFAAL